jgi:hypothetical protein
MAFRQNSQRDDRRRRVLCEESTGGGTWTGSASAAHQDSDGNQGGPRYTDAAMRDSQPRVTDFVAMRPLVHVAIIAALITAVAAIVGLDHYAPTWNAALGQTALQTFDLAQQGSLASWFSALLLAGSAASAGLIYRIRRHRIDDYRGRYRIWLWAAGGFLLLSADAVAGLHQAVQGLLIYATQTKLLGDGAAWWMIVWAACFGSLGAALLYDLRGSRAATTALAVGAVGYLAAALIALDVIPSGNVAPGVLTATCVLLAHGCMFVSLQSYARYVILDAEGKLPIVPSVEKDKAKSDAPAKAKQKKPTPQERLAAQTAAPKPRRSDLDPVEAQQQPSARLYDEYEDDEQEFHQAKRRAKKQKQKQSPRVETDNDWDQPQQRKLSKAERKRLRKQKMLERMDDAA